MFVSVGTGTRCYAWLGPKNAEVYLEATWSVMIRAFSFQWLFHTSIWHDKPCR